MNYIEVETFSVIEPLTEDGTTKSIVSVKEKIPNPDDRHHACLICPVAQFPECSKICPIFEDLQRKHREGKQEL